jgi:hypothetical protein
VNVNRRFLFVPSVVAVLYLCNVPNGLASVGGTIGDGGTGTAGTLYINLTPHAMNFELILTSFGNSTDSASWTDEGGKAQTVTVGPQLSTVVSSSLPANGAIVWNSTLSIPDLEWQLERAPAASVSTPLPNGLALPVPSSGTLYTNLTAGTVTLDVSVQSGGDSAEFTVSWTDACGHSQTITLGNTDSEGVSTSLPSGGAISWTLSGGSGGTNGFGWQVERVVR